MKTRVVQRAFGSLFLSLALLSGITVLSVSVVRAQGRRGSDGGSRSSSSSGGSSRSSGSSSRSSGSPSRSSGSSSRSNSSGSRSSQNRGSADSRNRASSDGNRGNRDRATNNNSSSSGNSSQSWARGRDRDRDRDKDRNGDHFRHRGRDRDRDRRHNLSRDQFLYRRSTRIYQSSNYGGYRYSSNAYDQGYQDGLFTGANDGRRGQSYDPERSHFYKRGASGFLSIFGSPDSYSLAYRDGFLRGYEEGYQHYEMYFSGGRFHR